MPVLFQCNGAERARRCNSPGCVVGKPRVGWGPQLGRAGIWRATIVALVRGPVGRRRLRAWGWAGLRGWIARGKLGQRMGHFRQRRNGGVRGARLPRRGVCLEKLFWWGILMCPRRVQTLANVFRFSGWCPRVCSVASRAAETQEPGYSYTTIQMWQSQILTRVCKQRRLVRSRGRGR